MTKSLKEIASLIGGELIGDENLNITSVNGIIEAGEGEITFLANSRYKPLLETTKASCIITSKDVEPSKRAIIRVEDPSVAFTKVIAIFSTNTIKPLAKGVDEKAVIGKDVKIGKDAVSYTHLTLPTKRIV